MHVHDHERTHIRLNIHRHPRRTYASVCALPRCTTPRPGPPAHAAHVSCPHHAPSDAFRRAVVPSHLTDAHPPGSRATYRSPGYHPLVGPLTCTAPRAHVPSPRMCVLHAAVLRHPRAHRAHVYPRSPAPSRTPRPLSTSPGPAAALPGHGPLATMPPGHPNPRCRLHRRQHVTPITPLTWPSIGHHTRARPNAPQLSPRHPDARRCTTTRPAHQ